MVTTARQRVEAELVKAGHAAGREFPVVGTDAFPTPWDVRHQRIDALLEDWAASE